MNHSPAEAIRTRVEFLRNYHHLIVRSGEERLRAAMADYLQHFLSQQEREAA